jgi:phage terminase small subunit
VDDAAIAEYLKRPPEQVRLAELYPELPQPIPFAEACADPLWEDGDDEEERPAEGEHLYYISVPIPKPYGSLSTSFAVTEHHHRIVEEYGAAQERQADGEDACAAARWKKRPAPPPRAPEPEDIPPDGKLTPRQQEFCRHYAAQPVATRAAILAGYSEDNAAPYGSRLLNNPLVLDRIAKLRAEQRIRYVVERDTVHDKLEAVFFGALGERNHAAAVSALRLQASLAGMLGLAAAKRRAKESQGATSKKPRKAKAAPRLKPRKAKAPSRRKPRKANKSQ